MASTNPNAQYKRLDSVDLIGADFDRPTSEPANRTLILCAGPRTGSYELCRFLIAAGIGVPHEYFHPRYSQVLATRWGLPGHPLEEEGRLGRYIAALRRQRAQNGIFATKLQHGQFKEFLRNSHGAALFEGATFVHLFRPDAASQYASWRAAMESGTWDFSGRRVSIPKVRDRRNFDMFFKEAIGELFSILDEDAGFRRLFILLNVRPIFVTTDELFREPRAVVARIAAAMQVSIDEEALAGVIALTAPYGRDRAREAAMAGLAAGFKKLAFQRKG